MLAALLLPAPPTLPSATELFASVQKAYDAVRTFEQDATTEVGGQKATAHISFARPGRLRVAGTTLFGTKYDLLSTGKASWLVTTGTWKPIKDAETGIASITGISGGTGTLVPATLLHTSWGNLSPYAAEGASVKEETAGGRTLLRVETPNPYSETLWIDPKSRFVVRTRTMLGEQESIIAYSAPKVNGTIPASRFKR